MNKMINLTKMSLLLLLAVAVTSCQEDTKTVEKEVVKEIYKPTDIQVLKAQYDLQSGLVTKNLTGINDEEGDKQINNSNSLTWIVGHTVDIQYNLAMLLGVASENPYAEQFGFGKPFDSNADYPALSKMTADFDALTPKVSTALSNLTEEQLNNKTPFPIPFPEQTMRGLYAFQMHHFGYELGQIGLYRKFLGKSAFSYQ